MAVINNYRRNDWTPYLMKTTDYGESWENIASDKGLEGYMLSFVQDPVEPNLMFAGTEFGLYISIDGGETWTEWENGYPTASTYDMVIHPREHDLVIGTFGRSAWVLDDIRPLRELAQNGIGELDKKINLYPVPDAYLAAEIEAAGTRFIGDGMFTGENRPEGARLTYSVVKEPEEDKSDEEQEEEEEEVTIEIYDSDRNKIRTLKETPEFDGINRTIWGLEEKGVRGPRRERPDEDDEEPSGPNVLPGTYKVMMTYEDQSDSAMVDVHFDPRISYNMADLRAKQESEAVEDSVNALLDYVFGKEMEGQGIIRNPDPNVASRLREPSGYIESSIGAPSSTERILMRQAREAVGTTLEKINSFFEDEWPDYVDEMENADLSPFKQFGTVSLE